MVLKKFFNLWNFPNKTTEKEISVLLMPAKGKHILKLS